MATRTRQTLAVLISALLLAACATRGSAPATPANSAVTGTPAAATPSAAAPAPDESRTAAPTPRPTISCASGTHLRAGDCLINPRKTTA